MRSEHGSGGPRGTAELGGLRDPHAGRVFMIPRGVVPIERIEPPDPGIFRPGQLALGVGIMLCFHDATHCRPPGTAFVSNPSPDTRQQSRNSIAGESQGTVIEFSTCLESPGNGGMTREVPGPTPAGLSTGGSRSVRHTPAGRQPYPPETVDRGNVAGSRADFDGGRRRSIPVGAPARPHRATPKRSPDAPLPHADLASAGPTSLKVTPGLRGATNYYHDTR